MYTAFYAGFVRQDETIVERDPQKRAFADDIRSEKVNVVVGLWHG